MIRTFSLRKEMGSRLAVEGPFPWTKLALPLLMAAGAVLPAVGQQHHVVPPPATCTSETRVTPSLTSGPFYKIGSPERVSLVEPAMAGTKLTVTGYVLSRGDCKPVARAWLDFWQASDSGVYDNTGYRLRGHQFADSAGLYYLETIMPGLYPGRTRHIHVKVRAPNGPTLTTQIYFPGEARNQSDGIFNRALLADVRDDAGGKVAAFNFVVDAR
jgi:protocatechuate 3,4-dioxygenase beta subunit